MNELDMKRPALIGGLIIGLGSVIPFISLLNCCFCAWALIGGMVASKMLISDSPRPLLIADGAKMGVFAGLVGGGIYLIGLPLITAISGGLTETMLGIFERFAENNPEMQEQLRQLIEQTSKQSTAQRVIGSVPLAVIGGAFLVGFSTLGGLLGVKFFEKRQGMPQDPYSPGGGGSWPNA